MFYRFFRDQMFQWGTKYGTSRQHQEKMSMVSEKRVREIIYESVRDEVVVRNTNDCESRSSLNRNDCTNLRLTWLDRTWGGQRNVEAVQADITQQWNVNTISMTNCTHLQVQQITTFLLALLFYQSIPFTPLLHLPAPPLPPRPFPSVTFENTWWSTWKKTGTQPGDWVVVHSWEC